MTRITRVHTHKEIGIGLSSQITSRKKKDCYWNRTTESAFAYVDFSKSLC